MPEDWKPCKTPEGELYYFNFSTGDSVWDHPCDDYYRNMYEAEKAAKAKRAKTLLTASASGPKGKLLKKKKQKEAWGDTPVDMPLAPVDTPSVEDPVEEPVQTKKLRPGSRVRVRASLQRSQGSGPPYLDRYKYEVKDNGE